MRSWAPVLVFIGCSSDPEPPAASTPTSGEGLFAEGCPAAGRSLARVIGVDAALPGKAAVGTRGDLLIANSRAAFVITDVVGQSTYWYYGGAIADGAPMDGCMAGEDKLDDLGFVFAALDLGAVEQSVIRAFRAERVEVLADGSDGGAAVVRATGVDDLHWLVEHTLINDAVDKGGRPVSGPFGVAITVDYRLAPDSAVLEAEITLTNTGASQVTLAQASLMSFGETLHQYAYAGERLSLGGFGFDAGMPWVLATDGAGAYAWGGPEASLAKLEIAGVHVTVDLAQVLSQFALQPGASRSLTRYLAVGDGAGASVLGSLLEANPVPMLDGPALPATVTGTLHDGAGEPVAGAVRLEGRAPGGEWDALDEAPTSDGSFAFVVPAFDAGAWAFRLVGTDPGRDDSAPVDVAGGDTDVRIEVPPRGTLAYRITDATGAPSPGRLALERDDGAKRDVWLADAGELGLPPGAWSWTLTRGYEFQPDRGTFTMPADGSATIHPVVERVVDTAGWIGVDTHVHTSDSPDSDVPQADQVLHAAAHGLEVVIHTEHENIVDRRSVPRDEGLADWVVSVIGEEVTSVGIEHMTLFPLEPDGTPRGGYVRWYGLDIAQLLGAMEDRSQDGIRLLNHPSYLGRIGWDPVLAAPTLDDPTLLGLPPDAALWSWNLDGMEVMNGHGDIFASGNHRFDDWMSMVNAGHPLVGVGCSDDHGGNRVGFPRTYVSAATDLPAELSVPELVDAFRGGRAQLSAGGFARVAIDGAGPGETVTDTDGMVELEVHLEALPEVDMTHFVVFVNCDMVDAVRTTDPDAVQKFSEAVTVPVVGDGQVVVAAFGTTPLPAGLPSYDATRTPRVLTNPIYVDGDGDGVFSAPGGRSCTYDLSVDAAR